MVLCAAAQAAPDGTAGADAYHLDLRAAGGATSLPARQAAVTPPAPASRSGSDSRLPDPPPRQDEVVVLLSNSDAFVRANMHLTLSTSWRGFVYADIGATDSQLRWQGLAGVHPGRGVDLLGGWRHVTYRFSPGKGFDSLEFNGPYLGASLAW
jgi:hypothetical protein